jgi:hypothetical protein
VTNKQVFKKKRQQASKKSVRAEGVSLRFSPPSAAGDSDAM